MRCVDVHHTRCSGQERDGQALEWALLDYATMPGMHLRASCTSPCLARCVLQGRPRMHRATNRVADWAAPRVTHAVESAAADTLTPRTLLALQSDTQNTTHAAVENHLHDTFDCTHHCSPSPKPDTTDVYEGLPCWTMMPAHGALTDDILASTLTIV